MVIGLLSDSYFTKMNKVDAFPGRFAPQAELLSWNLSRLSSVAANYPDRCKQCDSNQTAGKRVHAMRAVAFSLPLLFIAAGGALFPENVSATPAFVHGYYSCPQTAQSTVPVTFAAAQTAGNLNVVVGWNDTTAIVSTVTDKAGNTYQLAVGPTILSGTLSQAIYYAKNIRQFVQARF